MSLGVFDWLILVILGLSTIVGLFVGFIRSILSVLVWAGALVASMVFGPGLTQMFADFTSSPAIQLWASYTVVFVGSVLVGWVIKLIVGLMLMGSRPNLMNSLLGALFGFIRGVLLVVVLTWFAILSGVSQSSLYQQSHLPPYFAVMADVVAQIFPGASAAIKSASAEVSSGAQGITSSVGSVAGGFGGGSGSSGSFGGGAGTSSGFGGGEPSAAGGALGGISGNMGGVAATAQGLADQVTKTIQSNLNTMGH